MKKTSLYIAGLVFGAIALQSCEDNWTRPPMDVPTFPAGIKANISIADLKTQYWQDTESYGTTIGKNAEGDSLVIIGTIVSSDVAGNIYKSIVVQDETGAVTIGVNQSKLYEEYPMGVAVSINVTGMAIGRYSGLMQLGTLDGNGVNRMGLDALSPRTHLDYFAGKPDTTVVTLDELNDASKSTEGKIKWQSRLVRINDIKFVEAGEPFSNGSTTSRYITDASGNRMIVYNSSFADFAYDPLPYGTGDVVGILSCYRTSWQLLLIDANSCIDFDGEGAPDPNLTTVLNAPFSASSQDGFTIDNIYMEDGISYVWQATASYGMTASAFANSKSHQSDSWLVSPVVDLTNFDTPILTFSHCVNKFSADPATQVTLGVRVEGSEEWTAVKIPTYSSNADWTFVDSGEIDLNAFAGKKIQIGFHYTSTAASAGTWEVRNVKLTAIKKQ